MYAIVISAVILLTGSQAARMDVPAWADSAFRNAPQYSTYEYLSRLDPNVAIADFDGDGLEDVVFAIRSRDGLQQGLAVIHRVDGSVHILGAGRDVGDGNQEIRNWSVARLRHNKSGILVQRANNKNGLLVWDGQDHEYHWVAS